MKKVYDLAVKTGSYEKGGETKNRYEQIGSIMEGDSGQFMILKKSFNPAGISQGDGKDSIIVSMFAPKPADANSNSNKISDNFENPFASDSIPF